MQIYLLKKCMYIYIYFRLNFAKKLGSQVALHCHCSRPQDCQQPSFASFEPQVGE